MSFLGVTTIGAHHSVGSVTGSMIPCVWSTISSAVLYNKSQMLTMITPFGRFKFLRAPYGISLISEHYNRRMDKAFAGLSGFRRIVDDVIYDSNATHQADHVRNSFNTSKWKFSQPKVTFAGVILSGEGYQIDQSITEAISQFPMPTNRTELHSRLVQRR